MNQNHEDNSESESLPRGRFAIALGKRPTSQEEEVAVVDSTEIESTFPHQIAATEWIKQRAYRIYQARLAAGISGTAEHDWLRAEREFRQSSPIRIVWAEGLNDAETERLREQIEMVLKDPDYTIVANYSIHWETIRPSFWGHQVVWAEDIGDDDIEALRQQVDRALLDPDYTIVTNYEIHWDEHE